MITQENYTSPGAFSLYPHIPSSAKNEIHLLAP